MKRTPLLLVAGGVLTTAAVLIALPTPASAHSATVVGSAVCVANGGWQVTWTVSSDSDLNWKLTGPSGWETDFEPSGHSFTETVGYPAAESTASVLVSAEWSNGERGSAEGSTDRPANCDVTTTTSPKTDTTTTVAGTTTTTVAATTTTVADTTTTTSSTTTTTTPSQTSTTSPPTSVGGQSGTSTSVASPSPTPTSVGGQSGTSTSVASPSPTPTSVGGQSGQLPVTR